ncbi:hypothetical protein PIROE2DRAFT_14180 [Piromyces sp. E2]|nr:hypothetical protein PIROE2DRAFT_14180 [Piromyces sp. E2]|eukprot:OUM60121.1 hypothetical protein PIROE2DRAFT_14180 [Piromyces sp. E2]
MNKYIIKQEKFKYLVKNVQHLLSSKIYKDQGISFDKYVRDTWNISKDKKII